MALPEDTGKLIRKHRNERGLTQEQLPARLTVLGVPDVHQRWVSKTELGRRQLTLEDLFLVALALGVSPVRLLAKDDDDAEIHLANFPPGGKMTITHRELRMWLAGMLDELIHWDG